MAEHFKFYPADDEVVTPWNARYSYPSQANKAIKMTPRIPPKNGSVFSPGQIIRLEFPAQGYVNAANTMLEFDVTLVAPVVSSGAFAARFQNNIQCIFNRVRLLYGANPQEDILQYNVLVRCLTAWTTTNQNFSLDQSTISDGIGGICLGTVTNVAAGVYSSNLGITNVRQAYIQGTQGGLTGTGAPFTGTAGIGNGVVPNSGIQVSGGTATGTYCTRRYMVNFALGVFTQDKLIPTKWMASQLAIEITLENANACIFQPYVTNVTTNPTYLVGNINLIPEIIEFDDTYDQQFLKGLESGGVPIKFSTWHYFQFTTQGASSLQLQITERSRSVKGIFCVQRRNPVGFQYDSHATFFDTATTAAATVNTDGSSMQQFQYRIGGRYFPASPVQLTINVGGKQTNGGSEAYAELEKFLNIVGDYRLSTNTNCLNWAAGIQLTNDASGSITSALYPEYDYGFFQTGYTSQGNALVVRSESATSAFSGNLASSNFACAINFETSNGVEISGLNAEEQSDISFNPQWSAGQSVGFSIEAFTYVDVMWVLRPNNYLDLVQ